MPELLDAHSDFTPTFVGLLQRTNPTYIACAHFHTPANPEPSPQKFTTQSNSYSMMFSELYFDQVLKPGEPRTQARSEVFSRINAPPAVIIHVSTEPDLGIKCCAAEIPSLQESELLLGMGMHMFSRLDPSCALQGGKPVDGLRFRA